MNNLEADMQASFHNKLGQLIADHADTWHRVEVSNEAIGQTMVSGLMLSAVMLLAANTDTTAESFGEGSKALFEKVKPAVVAAMGAANETVH